MSDHPKPEAAPKRVFAVSSGGGHWVQLRRLLPALEGQHVTIVTTEASARGEVECDRFYLVKDASMWNKPALVRSALRMLWLLLKHRPQVVLSTGAAPGFFAVAFGRLLGARTVWVDSIANAEVLSLSGQKAGRFAHLWLTQWPNLARPGGPQYMGSVL